MKTPNIILTIFIFCIGCNHTPKTNSKTANPNKDSLQNVEYIAFNGKVIDTIYIDSLTEKAIIYNDLLIDNKLYIVFSKLLVGKSSKGEPVSDYHGHFINSYKFENLPAKIGEIFNLDKLASASEDTAFKLGESCTEDDNIPFTRLNAFPDSDSKIYIYARLPLCSDWVDHIILEKVNRHFEKLFDIESTDSEINFKKTNDSIIYCKYNQLTEEKITSFEYKYDFKNKMIIKNDSIKQDNQ